VRDLLAAIATSAPHREAGLDQAAAREAALDEAGRTALGSGTLR
jgi:hypothetical protein